MIMIEKPVISSDFTIEDAYKLKGCTKKQLEKKRALQELELLRKKETIIDYDSELASHREEKYG